MSEEKRRLFFALETVAPWPEDLPRGRILDPAHRHMTLAFLGWCNYQKVSNSLLSLPLPPLKVGLTGFFDKCLLLPPRHPHVVAWHVQWMDHIEAIRLYQKSLVAYLNQQGLPVDDKRDFLPHVTLCRSPFQAQAWEKAFQPLPLMASRFHLYESLGHLNYQPIWTYSLKNPFEEIDHTADVAFHIRAETIEQLYHHAFTALAFKFPPLLAFFSATRKIKDLEDIVIALNDFVSLADEKLGCPFKAVSFHGDVQQEQDQTLHWEMIIDV